MKTLVTHIGPDLDAITGIWLVKTFFSGWEEASFAFVPAGQTLEGKPPDGNPDILHVDTGFGKFDHHQTDADTCASRLVLDEIQKTNGQDEALTRLVTVVNDVDHFREAFFPNPTADFWDIGLVAQIDGWRLLYADNPIRIVELGMAALDGIYKTFQNKVWAERELREKSIEFSTKWGKGIGVTTVNDEVVHLGQKMGYVVVVRKDPKKGYLRIKALPKAEIDLTPVYNRLKALDPSATWFLHASRHMVLNGSSKNPDMKPTKKSLPEIIEVIKNV
ncbi:MAG: chromate resistance protein ChrB domain-containing protein [Patescibacteria group bacterium]